MEYFIVDRETLDGPYDLIGMIRKIRNGSVTEETLLAPSRFAEAEPAARYPGLQEVFDEVRHPSEQAAISFEKRGLRDYLEAGVELLKTSSAVAIYSGIFMVLWLVIGIELMVGKGAIFGALGVVLCYFLLGGYMYGLVRFARGNPLDAGIVIKRMVETSVPMAVVALLAGVLMLPGLALIANITHAVTIAIVSPIVLIWLLLVLTLLAFAPVLIAEKGQDFWDAVTESARVILMHKGHHLGIVFALVALNFLLLPILPIILPVTMGALLELFDEHFV